MVHTKPVPPPHHHSDDSLKWEEFFGTTVDISSSLLDMYDNLVSKNKTTVPTSPHKDCTSSDAQTPTLATTQDQWDHQVHAADVQGTKHPQVVPYCQNRPSGEDEAEKKRPLSVSSLSSSSSSSSSSLPRNALDVKKSYLASIESLDDELSEDGGHITPGNCTALESSKWPNFRDKNPSHIERVLLEIVETERTYVRDLRQIIRGYLNHPHVGVSEENLKGLFGNIEDICRFNSTFLADLEQCGLDAIAIASCFVRHGNGFAVYTQYCTNYPRTVAILTDLMRNRETAEIFKNIVMHSDKESAGYPDIKNALSVMTGIAFHINEMKRKHEHAVRVQEIQSLLYGWQGRDLTTYGELVAEGSFRMLGAKALRHILLFDKILLVAKKKEEGILIYKAHIMCSDLMLIESIRGEPLCFHVIPFDNPRLQFTFQARNVDQKREWCLQLKQVILENYNAVIPSHARQLVLELGQSRNEDDGPVEKSSTRRLLSAPEYLERRRHERRKSSNNRSSLPGKTLGPDKVSTRRTRSCHRDASSDDQNPVVTQPWNVGQQPGDREQSSEERTKLRRGRLARRTWNGLAEETTDTENDEAVRPTQRSFASQAVWHGTDPAGEYVMFYFPRGRASADASPSNCAPGVSSSSDAVELPPIQTVVRPVEKSPVPSWKQNGAVRRVQSFTGLARAKVAASLHHTFSFCQQPLSRNHRPTNQPCPVNSLMDTTPAWLDSDDPSNSKKCDSLPRSFRPGPDLGSETLPVTDFGNKPWLPSSADNPEQKLVPPLVKYPIVDDTNSSYSDLPRVNGENVHPEHKIYLRQTSGRAVVKNLLSTVGSRFAIFRGSHVTDSAVLCNEPNVRTSSRSSLWSERELGTKNIGNKLMQSIAWMYGNTTKGRFKKDKSPESTVPASKQQDLSRYRTNSFSLGARMALPLESEYCVPSSLIMLPVPGESNKRPNSLQSESSNNTTSSGEKMWGSIDRSKAVCPVVLLDDSDHNEDSLSDASDNSADSYYERTFEEIENVLTEELFRDSAIYSDPEDADLSAAESSSFTKSYPADYCEQRIDVTSGSCAESPPDLEEGVECCTMSVQERRLELERWCAKEDRGSPGERDGKEGPLQMKGWVKHVVSKLQGDSP